MMTPRCLESLIVLAVIGSGCPAGVAWAQSAAPPGVTTQTLAGVEPQVPVGDVVYVSDNTGATIKGELAALTEDAVQVKVGAQVRSVAAAEVRRIVWQQPDSWLTGMLIGAGVGAVPGIYWLAADPNECSGICPEEYALIVIGAGVGGVVDLAIKTMVTVYSVEPRRGRTGRVILGPLVARDHMGVQVAVRF